MKLISMLVSSIGLAGVALAAPGIPEPDVIRFGTLTMDGQSVLAGDDVTILARVMGVANPVGMYHMGDNPEVGNQYVLRVRLETLQPGLTRSGNAAIVGETVRIFVKEGNGPEEQAAQFVVSQRGDVQQLNLVVAPCTGVMASNPPHCTIDARRPHVQGNAGALQGINSVSFTFDDDCDVAGAVSGDFTISCLPAGAPCPTINAANSVDQTVTVTLSGIIPTQKWTCITHTASGDQVCIGNLPGDADGSRGTVPADIIAIVDNLNHLPGAALPNERCDMDRSGACLPADIITLIDMLNGNGFIVWNGKSLPPLAACSNP